jgi:hypothetical protein
VTSGFQELALVKDSSRQHTIKMTTAKYLLFPAIRQAWGFDGQKKPRRVALAGFLD